MASTRKAISVPLNGAEYLELEAACEKESARSLPQYVRMRCGLPAGVIVGRVSVSEAPRRRPVRLALERRSVTINITQEEYVELDRQAGIASLSVPQYIRTRCGFAVRWTSNPRTEERDREEDEAWERLKRLGLEPEQYFEQF